MSETLTPDEYATVYRLEELLAVYRAFNESERWQKMRLMLSGEKWADLPECLARLCPRDELGHTSKYVTAEDLDDAIDGVRLFVPPEENAR